MLKLSATFFDAKMLHCIERFYIVKKYFLLAYKEIPALQYETNVCKYTKMERHTHH